MSELDDFSAVGTPAQAVATNSLDDFSAPLARPVAQQKAVVNANANPAEVQQAIKVGKDIGVPATVVQSDLPGYTDHARQQSAIKAAANPALEKYINDNRMASEASADDWDSLQNVSKAIEAAKPDYLYSQSAMKAIARIGQAFSAGATEGAGEQTPTGVSNEFISGMRQLGIFAPKPGEGNPFQSLNESMIMPVAAAVNTVMSSINATIYAGAGAAGQTAMEAGASQGTGERVKRDATNFANFLMVDAMASPKMKAGELSRETAPLSTEDFLHAVAGRMTREEIDAFIKAKPEHGPVLMIAKAESEAAALDRVVQTAQESKTKERTPELFEQAVAAHGDSVVHIDGAKVLELYQKEGKVPAEGDGLFGFVPDIAAKAEQAAATGGEVTIPMSKYVAHVDPAVHEGLRDNVRLHDDGVTLEEAKTAQEEIEAFHGTPHEVDKFDLTKIGTGEGAQSYGHGLYFAQNRKVSEGYAEKLAPTTVEGKPYAPETDPTHALIELYHGDTFKQTRGEYIQMLEGDIADLKASKLPGDRTPKQLEKIEFMKKQIEVLKSGKEIPNFDDNKGNLYKVSITANPNHFLDWDKPLSEQDPRIQEAAKALQAKHDLPFNAELNMENVTGQQLHDHLADELKDMSKKSAPDANGMYSFDNGKEAAMKELNAAGIPGIKYLDQGSRGTNTAEGTRNFVVFDDKLISIREKNGVAQMVEQAVEAQKLLLGMQNEPMLTLLFKDAKSVGITDSEFKKYSDLIAKQEQAILDKAVAVGKREAGRHMTPEWKRNEATIKEEVTAEFKASGPFAAERYLRQNKIDIAHERAGEVADGLAPLFGFETGQDLLAGLEALETERAASGKGFDVQRREAIASETQARMETKYGNLAENIGKEAREIALADHSFDVMAEEVRILAKAAGTSPSFGRNEMVSFAKQSFEGTNITEAAAWEKWRRAAEKGGRETEKALLKGDFAEAFQWKQKQFMASIMARESNKLAKVIDTAERKIDKYSSEPALKGMNQEFLEQLRQLYASVGIEQHIPPTLPLGSLADFVAGAEEQLAVAPWLYDKSPTKLADMTVQQFREFNDSMRSMEHVGQQVQKLISAHGAADLQNVIFDVAKELERFKFVDQPQNPTPISVARSVGRRIIGAHLLVERMFDYTDKFNPEGPLTQYIDRPLRDSNKKELELAEKASKMIRDLYPLVDATTAELVSNNIIPDKMDKTGLMKMTRHNLRQVMLNMGNFSNIQKLAEGFGINEADLRRWVDANANTKDIAYVNGVWKIFDMLKPEADAMQLRDTGVPADTIPAQPWEIGAGKLNGGYFPIVYDKYNSDIVGHRASKDPVFQQGYVSATTPHGYTVARTEYKGALDLSGNMLASRIQGQIHDIAFREAVRSTNRLISNQEFRTALAQRWGKEYADLLPGWLRDIANSHKMDDAYAQGAARAMSLIRQNIISTLIAYNPSTVLKHGFTAALMSGERVGFGDLAKATVELGLRDAARSAKDLVRRGPEVVPDEDYMQAFRDALDQGERGDSVRNFVLQSSAVMRARARQVDDTVRGAVDTLNQIGAKGLFMNVRDKNMQYGRFAVAFSDQLSAVPTWYAAYKQAYLRGAPHDDAVFAADKEVSRAHGSQFIGDKPMVTRSIPNTFIGEFAKLFTGLYNFYNHFANNNFQFAWDANAYLHGNPNAEPGAKAARLSRHVAVVLATLVIEEMATAPLDKDGKGLLHSLLMKAVHLFGGQFVGLREVTSGLSHGYGPASGMMGTLWKAGEESVKDLAKSTSAAGTVSKNWIKHTADSIGFLTGIGGSQIGRSGQFMYNTAKGRERPRTFNDWRQGLRTGSANPRVH